MASRIGVSYLLVSLLPSALQKQQLISDAWTFPPCRLVLFPKETDLGNGGRHLPLIVKFRRIKKSNKKASFFGFPLCQDWIPGKVPPPCKTRGRVIPSFFLGTHHGRNAASSLQGTSALEIFESVIGDFIIRKFRQQEKEKTLSFKNKI